MKFRQIFPHAFANINVRRRFPSIAVTLSFVMGLWLVPTATVQSAPVSDTNIPIATIAAEPRDVASVDGLMRAFYLVVNVAPNQPRLWARDRTLYSPWIRFVATSISKKGEVNVEVWNHQELVNVTEPMVRQGFSEREIHRDTQIYGNIAHVQSTYETELVGPTGVSRSRGVNSIEMYFDGHRWWITSVMWMTESPSYPIPAQFLPKPMTPG